MVDINELITVDKASEIVGKHPSTIRRWIHSKKLPATKVSGKYGVYLIRRSDILELMIKRLNKRI